MSVALAKPPAQDAMAPHDASIIERALIQGDLSKLSSEERTKYYIRVCESVGLNPMTEPFEYLNLNGKLRLYAKKNCSDQLRSIHRVSVTIVSRERTDEGLYIVTARATMPDGRTDESTGAVALFSKKGDDLANALMKAETKAKRRVTLSICGLSLLDETEIETVRGAEPPDRSELTATAVARQPEVSALAEEQAKRRLEDAKLVDAWIAHDLPGPNDPAALERFVHHNWGQVRHMDKNAAGKIWRALQARGRELGVAEHVIRAWCKEAPDHDPESDDGPADAELVEDEPPLAEPPDDVPLLADLETAEPPEAFTVVMDSLAKCTHLSHWRNHLKKHRPAIDKLPARWREQALVDERAVAMQLGAKAEEMP